MPREKVSAADLQDMIDTPSSSQEVDKRLAKIEAFMSKFDTTTMLVGDEQMIYFAAFNAALQGLASVMPNYSRKPDALYNFLGEAQRVGRCAVVYYRNGGKDVFITEHSKEMKRDTDA